MERVREPGWTAKPDAELHPVDAPTTRLEVLVADFEAVAPRADGLPERFRRLALYTPPAELIAQQTILLTSGGIDYLEKERRDVDGDGRSDLVFFYFDEKPSEPTGRGFIAATQSGQLVHAPMSGLASRTVAALASGCWTRLGGRAVQVMLWHRSSFDDAGPAVDHGSFTSAYAIGARGLERPTVHGVILAEGNDYAALVRTIPKEHGMAVDGNEEWSPLSPECSTSGTPVLAVAKPGGGYALLAGISLTEAGAGEPWPNGVERPAVKKVLSLTPREP